MITIYIETCKPIRKYIYYISYSNWNFVSKYNCYSDHSILQNLSQNHLHVILHHHVYCSQIKVSTSEMVSRNYSRTISIWIIYR